MLTLVFSGAAFAGALLADKFKPRRNDWRLFLQSLYVEDDDFGFPDDSRLEANPPADGKWHATRTSVPRPIDGSLVGNTVAWVRPGSGNAPAGALLFPRHPVVKVRGKREGLSVFDPRPVRSKVHPDAFYRPGRCLGQGAFGVVYEYVAESEGGTPLPESDGNEGPPLRFAAKWCPVVCSVDESKPDTPWTERSVLLRLKRFAEALDRRLAAPWPVAASSEVDSAVLASRLVHERKLPAAVAAPPPEPGFDRRLLFVAMEPARGDLTELKLRLTFTDAVNVTRAAFEDVARYHDETDLLHIDIKCQNFLFDERPPPGAGGGASGGAMLHVYASDLGSLTTPGQQGCLTYSSPAGVPNPAASWDVVAFQLGRAQFDCFDAHVRYVGPAVTACVFEITARRAF